MPSVDPVTGEIYEPTFTGQDYMTELDRLKAEKRQLIDEYRRLGSELAEATVEFKKTEATRAYWMKAHGETATFITKFIDGDEVVAEAMLRKLSVEAERDAVDKKIASTMQDINTERMQVAREQPTFNV